MDLKMRNGKWHAELNAMFGYWSQWGATEMRNEPKIITINHFGNGNAFSVQIKDFKLLQEREEEEEEEWGKQRSSPETQRVASNFNRQPNFLESMSSIKIRTVCIVSSLSVSLCLKCTLLVVSLWVLLVFNSDYLFSFSFSLLNLLFLFPNINRCLELLQHFHPNTAVYSIWTFSLGLLLSLH